MAGRNSSGDGELSKSIKRTEKRNSSVGWSPGRREAIPKGLGKSSKNPVKPKVRKSIGS